MSGYTKNRATVDGVEMAYIEVGEGDPIVFLHGNPTSSYLWRSVMPEVEGQGRLIAPDLVGMGDSAKLPNSGPDRYPFVEPRHYLDGLLEQLDVTDNAVFVVHDWGSALGFHYARRHEANVKGVAFMEAIVRPLAWDEWPHPVRALFQQFRMCRHWLNMGVPSAYSYCTAKWSKMSPYFLSVRTCRPPMPRATTG